MPLSIYTLGYAQWTVDQVDARLDELNGILVDVRHSPHTTKPGFAKADLETRFGARYVHLPSFGNTNYKEGPIELANPEHGLKALREVDPPPVLMCGCQHPESCHRSAVAQLVAARFEGTVKHLRSPRERAQPGLFGDEPEP